MTVGDKIKSLRLRDKMTQESLGKQLNMSRNNVSKWETNTSVPSLEHVKQLCKIFHIELHMLIDEDIIFDDELLERSRFVSPKFAFTIVSVVVMFVSFYGLFVNNNVGEALFVFALLSVAIIVYGLSSFIQKIIPLKQSFLIVPGLIFIYILLNQTLLILSGISGDYLLGHTFQNIALFIGLLAIVFAHFVLEYLSKKSFSIRLLHTVKNIIVPLLLLYALQVFFAFDEIMYETSPQMLTTINPFLVFLILLIPSVLLLIILLHYTKSNWRNRRNALLVTVIVWIIASILSQNYSLYLGFFDVDYLWISLLSLLVLTAFFLLTSFQELKKILK